MSSFNKNIQADFSLVAVIFNGNKKFIFYMKKNNFLLNKYTLSLFILLLCLAADIILHKGMSRVMMPESFTAKRSARQFARCEQPLVLAGKSWIKGVNTVLQIEQLDSHVAGFEMDVYFDTLQNYLQVYHDSSGYSNLPIESILAVYKARNLSSSIWLDFKNLSAYNEKQSLNYIAALRKQYQLQDKIIVESSSPEFLQSFCDSNFYTSYYTPYFNPYRISENELVIQLDGISNVLGKYKVSSLSGYYFQYPVLKKYFPNYPILTWTDKSSLSLVSKSFNKRLLADSHVKVLLFP
jgi:hypothetical protein